MYGEGVQRKCSGCGRSNSGLADDSIARRELRGPRQITGTNVDVLLHDGSRDKDRFLAIEAKRWGEQVPTGQRWALEGLSKVPGFEVWIAEGTPDRMQVHRVKGRDRILLYGESGSPVSNFAEYQDAVWSWFGVLPQHREAA